METNKSLAHAGYLVGALLFITPLWDAAMRLAPAQFGNERWRFQVIGGASSLTLVPLIGLLVVLVAAGYVGHERAKRSIGILCIVLAVAVAVLAATFLVDYSHVKSAFPPATQHAALVASTMAVLKYVATIAVLALLGLAGLDRAPRRSALLR